MQPGAIGPAFCLVLGLAAGSGPSDLLAQTDGTCVPIAERGSRVLGCYITGRHELGSLPRDTALYWHIDAFASLTEAAEHQSGRSIALESLGQAWLFTIGPRDRRATAGRSRAVIGPLPLVPTAAFAAVYMEGVFTPGMASVVHRHPGAEAWYTLEGAQCLETPKGKLLQRAGDPGVLVPGGEPMQLTGVGTSLRRSLVLILQDSAQPRSTPAHDWQPTGLCRP